MAHDVFLSYAHADKVFADAICHKLEANAIRCWVAPRDIRPSEDWAEAIINAMDHAQVLVLVFSANSNRSPQVRREVERAVNKGLHILPLRIENVPLSKSLEYFISTQHWLDALDGEIDFHLGQLHECIAVLLERGAAGAPARPQAAAAAMPVPPAAAAPVASVFDPQLLAMLEAALAQVLGPIAKHLVRRGAQFASSAQELVTALSLEIDDGNERKLFVTRCRTALG
ncbi:MAG: toll/interleukin-1 receptor domain-containing protein [Pseudomonadota bacterium]|nr:toll/interleukin-1 receptor domain-containing protein [Pseudomonadota bacterium]